MAQSPNTYVRYAVTKDLGCRLFWHRRPLLPPRLLQRVLPHLSPLLRAWSTTCFGNHYDYTTFDVVLCDDVVESVPIPTWLQRERDLMNDRMVKFFEKSLVLYKQLVMLHSARR